MWHGCRKGYDIYISGPNNLNCLNNLYSKTYTFKLLLQGNQHHHQVDIWNMSESHPQHTHYSSVIKRSQGAEFWHSWSDPRLAENVGRENLPLLEMGCAAILGRTANSKKGKSKCLACKAAQIGDVPASVCSLCTLSKVNLNVIQALWMVKFSPCCCNTCVIPPEKKDYFPFISSSTEPQATDFLKQEKKS